MSVLEEDRGGGSWCGAWDTSVVMTRSAAAHGVMDSLLTWKGTSKRWHFRVEPFSYSSLCNLCLQTGVSCGPSVIPPSRNAPGPKLNADIHVSSQCLWLQVIMLAYKFSNLFQPSQVKNSTGDSLRAWNGGKSKISLVFLRPGVVETVSPTSQPSD